MVLGWSSKTVISIVIRIKMQYNVFNSVPYSPHALVDFHSSYYYEAFDFAYGNFADFMDPHSMENALNEFGIEIGVGRGYKESMELSNKLMAESMIIAIY